MVLVNIDLGTPTKKRIHIKTLVHRGLFESECEKFVYKLDRNMTLNSYFLSYIIASVC